MTPAVTRSLANDRHVPSLRWRLLLRVSLAALVILALVAGMSYRRARHEVQELMDDQLAKTAQLMLAEAVEGEAQLVNLPQRLAGIRGLRSRRNALTLEYQVGRPDGTVLVRSIQAPRAPLAGELGYANVEDGGVLWRCLTLESADGNYRVQIAESIPKRNKEALEIAVKTVQPMAFMFPLLLLVIYVSVRRGLKPLDDLANEVAMRSSDNLSALLGPQVPREARPLVAAINRLLHRLAGSLENERRFTADAAHELRTPLAAARIQAQVAQLANDAGQRTHALSQTMAGLDRATRLVEQLLRLARLDPLAHLSTTQAIDLTEVAQRVVAAAQDSMPQARLQLDAAANMPMALGDADLLEVALRNLVDNAIRYSPEGSDVAVVLGVDGEQPWVSVRDSGPGVAAEEVPRLMERFYRGTSVTAEGNGLGLTIVARIAELHGAALVLANREGGGFEASLRWHA